MSSSHSLDLNFSEWLLSSDLRTWDIRQPSIGSAFCRCRLFERHVTQRAGDTFCVRQTDLSDSHNFTGSRDLRSQSALLASNIEAS